MTLPPFPVDDQTLDMLSDAIDPDPKHASSSSLWAVCELYSELAGSDPTAVESEHCGVLVMRDPTYHPNDVVRSLVAEIRRLRP